MTFYDFFTKKNIHPMKMKNTTIGSVFSYNKGTCAQEKGLMVIGPSKNVGLIRTQYVPLCFTEINNSFYYGYWNLSSKYYQIGCIASTGVETFISGEKMTYDISKNPPQWIREPGKTYFSRILEMHTTSDNRCVILHEDKIAGCLQYVNPDGTTERIVKINVDLPKDFVITKENHFLILDNYGVLKVTPEGNSQRIVFTDVLRTCYNLNYLANRILFINDRKLMCYKTDKYQNSKEGKLILDESILYRKDIGKYIKGFHIVKGVKGVKGCEIIIWTNKGIYESGNSFKLPNPKLIYRNRLPYLWNPKLVEVLKLSKQAYCYARTFILCVNRILETDETLPELPDELLNIILSHSDTWRFPGKKLNIL